MGYDDRKLYEFGVDRGGYELLCPISEIRQHTSSERMELINFYESELGQTIYHWRGISVEPLIEHIKSVFRIDPVPVRGYHMAAGIVLMSVLLYQIMVYYNCIIGKTNPKEIKYMLGS